MPIKYERLYGVATTVNFPLFEADGVDLRVDAVHASGDTTIMKDEGAPANTGSGFVDEGEAYSLALTAAEMTAARVVIKIVDQTATKVWLDEILTIETYGNENAQHNRRIPGVILETTVASVSSQDPLTFVVTDKPNDNNTLLSAVAEIIDNSTPGSPPDRLFTTVTSYTGSSGTVIGTAGTQPFTVAAGDIVRFLVSADVASAVEIAAAVAAFILSGETTAGSLSKTISDIETDIAAVQTTVDDNGTAIADVDAAVALTPQTTARLLRARKNATFSDIPFKMIDSADQVSGKTGLTVTVQRSIDGGAFGSGTGTATEIANGNYQYDASAADMNGDKILFRFTGTGALATELTIFTTP